MTDFRGGDEEGEEEGEEAEVKFGMLEGDEDTRLQTASQTR